VIAEDWFRQIEDLVENGHRSPSTLGLYRHVLDRHVLRGLGSLRLSEITPSRVDHFLQDKRRSTGYSTAKLCRSVASGVCGLAVRRDALRSNSVRDVSTLERRGGKEARALTPDEAREWLELLDSSDFAKRKDLPDLVRFLLGTRCRLGEAVGVRWDDLDLDRHLLHVRRTIIRVRGARTRSEAAQDAIR
jgi:integrase